MANYDLAFPGAAIDAILTTAYDLQNAGYIFKGSATAYSGTPTQRTWLLAPAGFSGYGFSSAIPKGSIGICKWNGSAWSGDVINVVTIDNYPTYGSTNAVTSGGMWNALDDLGDGIWATLQSFVIQDGTASANQGTQIKFDVKMTDGQQVQHLISSFGILAATTTKAGLMSAADKAKVDAFLDNLRSLSFTDTTPGADVGTKIVETLKMTVDGVQEAVTALTILAATTSKAGLMSATDKAYIDGLPTSLSTISTSISNLLAMLGYYECSTAAATAAKAVVASGYQLAIGGCIRIKMTNANTANNVTLNINSTGAKALYYDGTQASSTNTWEAGEVLEVYYDGTQYQCASGGGKFATGQVVKEVSITDNVSPNSDALPTSNAVYSSQRNFPITSITSSDSDFEITDEEGYVIASFDDGHIRTKNFDSAFATSGAFDSSDNDFDITDKNGNVIMGLKDGHIKTKNFDSSQITNRTPLETMAIGDLIQGSISGYGIAQSSLSLVTNILSIPYPSAELYITINPTYKVIAKLGYLNGDSGVNLNVALGTFTNGDSFKLPSSSEGYSNRSNVYLRFQIEKISGGQISPSDNIGFEVGYKPNYDIIDSNSDIIDQIQSKSARNYPIIVHGSDIHGDWERLKDIYKVADTIEADAIVLTGDMVAHHYTDNTKSLIALAKASRVPTFICAGNHEVGFAYGNINYSIDDATVYNYFFSELAEDIGYISSGSTISTKNYYYKDIPAKKIRIIGFYQYVEGAPDGNINSLRWDLHYDQLEMTWFCDTLLSTPADYGVILLVHTPERNQNGGKIQDNDLFFTLNNPFQTVRSTVTNGYPILEICDAFIARTTINKTYTQNGTPSSFTVNADFSQVPQSVGFIGQVSGHSHCDAIGLVAGATQRQVMLNITCTAGAYCQSRYGDTVRNIKNNTGDCFNVYVINTTTANIDVYKIGAHRTMDDRNRIHMTINYKS